MKALILNPRRRTKRKNPRGRKPISIAELGVRPRNIKTGSGKIAHTIGEKHLITVYETPKGFVRSKYSRTKKKKVINPRGRKPLRLSGTKHRLVVYETPTGLKRSPRKRYTKRVLNPRLKNVLSVNYITQLAIDGGLVLTGFLGADFLTEQTKNILPLPVEFKTNEWSNPVIKLGLALASTFAFPIIKIKTDISSKIVAGIIASGVKDVVDNLNLLQYLPTKSEIPTKGETSYITKEKELSYITSEPELSI